MIRINLLPRRRRRRLLVPEFGVVSVLLLVIGALAGSYIYGLARNDQVRRETDQIKQEVKDNERAVQDVLALQAKIDDLRARENLLCTLEKRELPWSELLVDLSQRTPRDAWLGGASVAAGGTSLTVSGAALSYNAVARYMTSLAGSRFYSDVVLQTAQDTTVGSAPVVTFGLSTPMRPVGAVPPGCAP